MSFRYVQLSIHRNNNLQAFTLQDYGNKAPFQIKNCTNDVASDVVLMAHVSLLHYTIKKNDESYFDKYGGLIFLFRNSSIIDRTALKPT